MYLRTLGHPALLDDDGKPVHKLRKKDLALLVYLCVEGTAVHSRGRLASLLWGESPDEAARHSLTQTLGRLVKVLPEGSLVLTAHEVRWGVPLSCDAVTLLRGELEPARVDDSFSIYQGEFLRGFDPGANAREFEEWVDGKRPHLRNTAIALLDLAGEDAEARGEWRRAARLAERAVQIDYFSEKAHRRLMRALAAAGERNRALRHYQDLVASLARDMDAEPDPETHALAERLRAEAADPPPAPPPRPVRPDPAPTRPAETPDPPPAPPPRPRDEAAVETDGGSDPGAEPATDPPDPPGPAAPVPPRANQWVAPPGAGERTVRRRTLASGAVLLGTLVGVAVWLSNRPVTPPEPVRHGETVRREGDDRLYLAFGETLYAYPDSATLRACTGGPPHAVRELRRLPDWPRITLPSVRQHPWIGGGVPVVSDAPLDKTAFVAVGCVLAGVPSPATLDSIFGPGALDRLTVVPDSVLRRMPRAFVARGYPVRPAGTLIRAPDGLIQWITYHGGALAVADSALLATYCRAPREAVSVTEQEFRYYHPFGRLYPARPPCRRHG